MMGFINGLFWCIGTITAYPHWKKFWLRPEHGDDVWTIKRMLTGYFACFFLCIIIWLLVLNEHFNEFIDNNKWLNKETDK